jgi:hypothetical protein
MNFQKCTFKKIGVKCKLSKPLTYFLFFFSLDIPFSLYSFVPFFVHHGSNFPPCYKCSCYTTNVSMFIETSSNTSPCFILCSTLFYRVPFYLYTQTNCVTTLFVFFLIKMQPFDNNKQNSFKNLH